MNVAIVEVMPRGHYTLVDSLIRIYCSDQKNKVFVFSNNKVKENLSSVLKEFKNVDYILKSENIFIEDYLNKIAQRKFDKVYIVTLDKYYKELFKTEFKSPVYLFIHNVDQWFASNIFFNLYHLIKDALTKNNFKYSLKNNIINYYWRKKIIQKIYSSNGKFVVLSENIKNELLKFTAESKIEIIPFSVYKKKNEKIKTNANILKITIPGFVSASRRDYFALFNVLQSKLSSYKSQFEIELLGGISKENNNEKVITEANKIIKMGFNIIYYNVEFLQSDEFDKKLSEADFILGNLKVVLDKFSKYGRTKESGFSFTMVSAAKPGLVISDYEQLEELKTSTIKFKNYYELADIIMNLINDKEKVKLLKEEAVKNSQQFEPGKIYRKLNLIN